MKRPRLSTFWTLRPAALLLLSALHVQADQLFWDSNATPGDGATNGAGFWNTTTANWYDGVSANRIWDNSKNDIATFGTGTGAFGAVTLATDITVGGLTFTTTNGQTITGTASFGLTLAAGAVINVGATSSINASLEGATDLIKTGGGTLVLNSFAASYTGNTYLRQASTQIRLQNYLPASTTVVIGTAGATTAASLALGASQTVAGLSAIGSSLTNNTITHSGQNNVTQTLTVNPDGAAAPADSTFAGVIRDADADSQLALTKAGSHVLILTGANTYSGATLVTGGSLRLNGSILPANSSGTLTVTAGSLEGHGNGVTTGITSAAVTIGDSTGNDDAILAPGDGVGTLTTTSTLSLLSDAVFKFELDSGASTADRMTANGISITSGAAFSFTDLNPGSAIVSGTVFTILDNTSAAPISGVFDNLANNASFIVGNYEYTANYAGGTGNDLTLTATLVPEPGTFATLFAGLASFAFVRRRRS